MEIELRTIAEFGIINLLMNFDIFTVINVS